MPFARFTSEGCATASGTCNDFTAASAHAGKTTGFVLWVNRRGVLVDPPYDATDILRAAGVQPRMVDAVVPTHCHADHDSGVFQKVLEEGRVSLYTTPTILGSFLRRWVVTRATFFITASGFLKTPLLIFW